VLAEITQLRYQGTGRPLRERETRSRIVHAREDTR